MAHSLVRILRLRSLLEDVSRVELEARLQQLTRVESALLRLQEIERDTRAQTFSDIAEDLNSDWIQAGTLTEWMEWERGVYERTLRRKAVAVEAARAEYLERRKECGQVKSVMEVRMSAKAIERSRREQRELDDWFGQKQMGRGQSNSLRFF